MITAVYKETDMYTFSLSQNAGMVSIAHATDIELWKMYKSLWMLYGECKNVIITSFHTN